MHLFMQPTLRALFTRLAGQCFLLGKYQTHLKIQICQVYVSTSAQIFCAQACAYTPSSSLAFKETPPPSAGTMIFLGAS